MKKYFGLSERYADLASKLKVDYSLDDVPDAHAMYSEAVPDSFFEKFKFEFIPGPQYEDVLANNVGWVIISPRIVSVLKSCRNVSDLQFLELPQSIFLPDERMKGFCVLGLRRKIACLDKSLSEIGWGKLPSGEKHVAALYKTVLQEALISEDYDVFHIAEYPGYPVLSHELAAEIAKLYPRGFVYKEIEAV